MKISLALALLILAAAASFHWQRSQRLAVVRGNYTQLVADAANFGITLDPARPSDPIRVTRRERENRGVDADAEATAAELIALAKDMELSMTSIGPGTEAQQIRMAEIMTRMMSMDSAQLQTLIAEVRAAKDLTDQTRENFVGLSLMTLSDDHPQAVLALFTESPDLLKEDGRTRDYIVSASLRQWGKNDSAALTELGNIANHIIDSTESDENGQWIDWISTKIPAEKSEARIRKIVSKWTQRDYQAVGKWLATSPASPTKNAAIRSYAETVSTLDPAVATQWAMTLPPGPDRDATLKHIQDHPPAR